MALNHNNNLIHTKLLKYWKKKLLLSYKGTLIYYIYIVCCILLKIHLSKYSMNNYKYIEGKIIWFFIKYLNETLKFKTFEKKIAL